MIALGLGHAVVAPHALFRIPTLLMSENHHRPIAQTRQSPDDRKIIPKHPIPVQLLIVAAHDVHVIKRIRAMWMTRELRDLPRRKTCEDVRRQLPALRLQARDLIPDIHLGVRGDVLELFDLRLKFGDRLFEVEKRDGHSSRYRFT